jgi:hypothetical protein
VDLFDLPDGDVTQLSFKGKHYDFIWASPPCTEYAKFCQPWYNREPLEADLGIWEHCLRLIDESRTPFYCIENSRGACQIWGTPAGVSGPFNFWGNLPEWPGPGAFWKFHNKMSSAKRAWLSAKIPFTISMKFCKIVEKWIYQRTL